MRADVSSSGRWWVSMGPLGWLLLLPVAVIWCAFLVLRGLAAGTAALIRAARS
jgi:hypothetical protein